MQQCKFPQEKVIVWLGACSSKGLAPLVILAEGTVDHSRYIKNVLLVALTYENEAFNDKWIFQQDVANPQRHHSTQEWYSNHWLRRNIGL